MVEEIVLENSRISNFKGLVTLTLTLDWATLHTVVNNSSISTFMPNFIETKKNFLWMDGRTYARTDGRTDGLESGFVTSTLSKSWPKYIDYSDRIKELHSMYTCYTDQYQCTSWAAAAVSVVQTAPRNDGSRNSTNWTRQDQKQFPARSSISAPCSAGWTGVLMDASSDNNIVRIYRKTLIATPMKTDENVSC